MTDMRKLRRKLKPFLASGVTVEKTKLEAGEAITLKYKKSTAVFDAVGDDHTFLSVSVDNEDLTA